MITVDINLNQLKVVFGKEQGGRINIYSAESRVLPDDVVVDGEVKDVVILAGEINDIIQKSGKKEKKAICSFSSSRIIYKDLDFPAPQVKDDWRPTIEAMIASAMGVATDSYKITYIITQVYNDDTGAQMIKVSATGCPSSVIEAYKYLFRQAGLKLHMLVASNNSISRIISHNKDYYLDSYPLLLIQLSEKFININLYDEGRVKISRYVNIDPLDYEEGADYISLAVFDNVFQTIHYWESISPDKPIKKIMYYGDVSDANSLTKAFESEFGVPVEPFGRPRGVTVTMSVDYLQYANLTGAFYSPDKRSENIDFLETTEFRETKQNKTTMMIAGVAAAAGIGASLIGFSILAGLKMDVNNTLESELKTLTNLKYDELIAKNDAQQAEIQRMESYLQLSELARTLSDFNPRLTSIIPEKIADALENGNGDSPSNVEIASAITISGYDLSIQFCISSSKCTDPNTDPENSVERQVARFIDYLNYEQGYFEGVECSSISGEMSVPPIYDDNGTTLVESKNDVYVFTVKMKLKGGNALEAY